MLFNIRQFGSSRKIVVASWLFRADGVACCTIMSICLSSYIGWQLENSVRCEENASVLEPNTFFLGGLFRIPKTKGLSPKAGLFFLL